MAKEPVPFLFVNPKSYLWGKASLALAKEVDRISRDYNMTIYFTCPYADIRMIAENTTDIIVTAQNMDPLKPGRGMGAVLPESLVEAGAKAVVLNHAENPKELSELHQSIVRAKELGLQTIVCADSMAEAKAAAVMGGQVILAEPTELIGTGQTADTSYIESCVNGVREGSPDALVMIASGITTPEDCYVVVYNGADGTGSTSGIVKAEDPAKRVEEMVQAIQKAVVDREKK